jgi:hypothetical protein
VFGSHVLETVAGLSFIYFVLSTFASAISEWIAALLSLRSKDLIKSIRNLLAEDQPPATSTPAAGSGQGLATALMNHPMIQNLSAPKLLGTGVSSPAYLDAKTFSVALSDLLAPGPGQQSLTSLRLAVDAMTNQDLKKALLPLLDRAGGSIDAARQNIESWYDTAMDRLSGLYKRRIQWILFALGLALAIILNVDTLRTTAQLWKDPALRAELMNEAGQVGATQNQTGADQSAAINMKMAGQALANLSSEKGMPIGWDQFARHAWTVNGFWTRAWSILNVFVGWIFTAIAISLGAPFWFDFLNKTLNLNARLNGPKPSKSTTTGQ